MTKQETIDFLLMHNATETGAMAVLDNIIRLIADGYEVTLSLGKFSNYDDGCDLPAVNVVAYLDGEWETEGTGVILSEVMAAVYQQCHEVA